MAAEEMKRRQQMTDKVFTKDQISAECRRPGNGKMLLDFHLSFIV
jgi:hypothetical protein